MSPTNPLDVIPPELRRIEGIDKLRRQIAKEIKSPNVNEKSSNLPHLLSILKCIHLTKNLTSGSTPTPTTSTSLPSAVLKPFSYSKSRSGRLVVDVVSPDGGVWYKVSARNPKALALLAAGGGNFGQKSIVAHVSDYLECAQENPSLFKCPKVVAVFTSGISESLALELQEMGAFVQGEIIPDSKLGSNPRIKVYSDSSNLQEFRDTILELEQTLNSTQDNYLFKNPSLDGVLKLNLDITTLLAYVSNLTNGHCNVNFTKKILADQAQAEGQRAQKPLLDKIFEGRELFICETALHEFNSILGTVGGPMEKERAKEFLKRVRLVPDNLSERVKSLPISGSVKNRSLVIFGTGDYLQAVTVTANTGFIRSAKTQGVDLASFVIESRALTEQKENLLIDNATN